MITSPPTLIGEEVNTARHTESEPPAKVALLVMAERERPTPRKQGHPKKTPLRSVSREERVTSREILAVWYFQTPTAT